MRILILLILFSCSNWFPPIRGQYRLTSLKHFLISNLYVNPANLEKDSTNLYIQYDIVVKNIDTHSHDINLVKSVIRVSGREYPLDCGNYQSQKKEFVLAANEQGRIVCKGTLRKNDFARSDYETMIEIPLDQDLAKFPYLLRTEDFD